NKNSADASKVVQASRPIFVKNGDIAGSEDFARNLGVKVEASEIDEINLASAKQLYIQKNYNAAIPLYDKYLSHNPTGEGMYQAQFELGESYCYNINITNA